MLCINFLTFVRQHLFIYALHDTSSICSHILNHSNSSCHSQTTIYLQLSTEDISHNKKRNLAKVPYQVLKKILNKYYSWIWKKKNNIKASRKYSYFLLLLHLELNCIWEQVHNIALTFCNRFKLISLSLDGLWWTGMDTVMK